MADEPLGIRQQRQGDAFLEGKCEWPRFAFVHHHRRGLEAFGPLGRAPTMMATKATAEEEEMSKKKTKRETRRRTAAKLREAEARIAELTEEVEFLRGSVERYKNRRPQRTRLPDTRRSITHKFSVTGHEGYITVGLFEDGSPGEVFIRMAKMGSTVRGLVDTIAVLTSLALQYDVPLANLARKFRHTRFEPSGHTNNPEIRRVTSIVDYVFAWLSETFPRYSESDAAKTRTT